MIKFFLPKTKKRPNLLLNHRKPTIKYSKSIKSFVRTRFKHLKVSENTQKMSNNEFKIFSSYQLTKLHPVYMYNSWIIPYIIQQEECKKKKKWVPLFYCMNSLTIFGMCQNNFQDFVNIFRKILEKISVIRSTEFVKEFRLDYICYSTKLYVWLANKILRFFCWLWHSYIIKASKIAF